MTEEDLDIMVRLEALDDLICQEKDEFKKETLQDIYNLIEELLNEKISR